MNVTVQSSQDSESVNKYSQWAGKMYIFCLPLFEKNAKDDLQAELFLAVNRAIGFPIIGFIAKPKSAACGNKNFTER